MISGKMAAVIAVVILAVFSTITIETIDHSGSSLSSSSLSTSGLSLYSPQNGTFITVASANQSFNVSISIKSNSASNVYLYDVSPNISALKNLSSEVSLYSIPNLTHMNSSLYPFNYQTVNVTASSNTTMNMTLYLNSTAYNQMNYTTSPTNPYPYVVEILAETSSGAAVVSITLLKESTTPP